MFNLKRQKLAKKIRDKNFFIAPGVFDMLSARIADKLNFDALYMTGYGTVASYLGLPDAGLASYRDMVNRVGVIASGVSKPLIADADTGYGGLINIAQTIKGYESSGACALHIEDQVNPKRCGHTKGKQLVSKDEMCSRLKVALDSRSDENFLIIARTDSLSEEGLANACRRSESYIKTGVDMLFVEGYRTISEMKEITSNFNNIPIMINLSEAGNTPKLDSNQLMELGFTLAIFPGTAFSASAATMQFVYKKLFDDKSTSRLSIPLLKGNDMHKLMGFEDIWNFENKWK
ncbi:MAG: carboxyvinyl-carboxyphosphonate phosphorylmutase [Rhodospirillaceae bacterium]|nr:carboxyvinyl-carboxyphosphonate phosphorylmutase [Rhodospirillaceae bacterium]|tara:strand:+ start:1890 stop:2759 length:870 start_codon:yes stop_codon:yes gene_type:complete